MNIPTINSKIALSIASMAVAGALVVGATIAFFSDTETSFDNILQAGALDLKIDSEAHYAGMVCTEVTPGVFLWQDEDQDLSNNPRTELIGQPCEGTWSLKDLEEGDTFFDLTDLKPGDRGENTISLHVFDNDAWGRIRVTDIEDRDNDCTEPETESSDAECNIFPSPVPTPDDNGELSENLSFFLWLDEGSIPGFQCADPALASPGPTPQPCEDTLEGNNIFDVQVEEPTTAPSIEFDGEDIIINLAPGLSEAFENECGEGDSPDGHNNYGNCHGLAEDGRLVGSATYYIGVAWQVDPDTGNEAQTDSVSADIVFEIEQHRNNPSPFPTP